MGRYLFRLPDIGEGIAEAEIVAWHVSVGDAIAEDQSLVDVMTDKATVDMTSPVDGVVLALHGPIGAMIPVGSVLVELEVEGAGNADEADLHPVHAAMPGHAAPDRAEPETGLVVPTPAPAQSTQLPPLASPSIRKRARELHIPLDRVTGSGRGGRITREDLDSYSALHSGQTQASGGPAALLPRVEVHETPIIGLRRRIADRLQDAKRRIPHISYVEECDLTELESLRAELNAHRKDDQPRLTLLPFLMRALVRTLPEFPQINAHFDDEAGVLRSFEAVHVGIATQTPAGLMVPVVHHAEARDIWDCARELARVAQAARDGTASRDELTGGTITLSSLGPIAGIASTPIVNHPEVAILAPNKLVERPVVLGGAVAIRKMMNLSSSFDHRIVDGWDAARFIQQIKRMLEHPALIFMG